MRGNVIDVSDEPAIIARGPWPVDRVEAVWVEEHFEPGKRHETQADIAISALRDRGSPSHDGIAGRLAGHRVTDDGRLLLEMQPIRWSLRLVEGDASESLACMTVIRDGDGRWLAGRRAAWVASWPERWALGAGGAVDPFENPADTLVREMREEWQLEPERVTVEALVRLPHNVIMLIGQAWVAAESDVVMDAEHDAYAWWPADPAEWPEEADEPLRRVGELLR